MDQEAYNHPKKTKPDANIESSNILLSMLSSLKSIQEIIVIFVEQIIPYNVSRVLMHQAFTVPGGTTETSLYEHKGVKMKYTILGIRGEHKGKKFTIPLANVIVAYE